MSVADSSDPREQRALALRRLAHAHYELDCALGYLRNSDPHSIVVTDVQVAADQVSKIQRMLEWRQQREATP